MRFRLGLLHRWSLADRGKTGAAFGVSTAAAADHYYSVFRLLLVAFLGHLWFCLEPRCGGGGVYRVLV